MMTDKDSSAAGTDNRPPMLEENDYESWRICIERYIKGKPHGKLIWKSIQNGPTAHPQTTDPAPEGDAVPPTRSKRDEEFTEEDNRNELADMQAISSGQTLERRKEALFDEFECFCENGNELIQDYFVHFYKLVNDMKVTQLDIPTHQLNIKFANNLPSYWGKYVTHAKNNMNMSTITYVKLFTHLRTYEEHALKSLKKKEQSFTVFPSTNNQLRTSSNPKTHATVHDGQIVTQTIQRRAPGNTGTKGIQTTGSGVNNSGKKVICYNCRGEGHVARQCKEPKHAHDSQWYHDKALLMQAKEKGAVLDAEAEAFLADVECTALYDQPLALTTTNLFEANHEDSYDSDVDEGPHASAAFMANLSSTGATNGSSSSHINEEEHLNSKVDSVLDDNMITYDEYQNDSEVKAVPTVVSVVEADKQSMIAVLQCMHTEIAGYVRVNDEHKLVNATLTAELERCKIEMQALERNKVKHDLDMAIVERNKQNAELEEENVMLKSTLKSKVVSIENLQKKSKHVLFEKKTLEDKYLKDIANDICSIALAYDLVVPSGSDSSHCMLKELRTTCDREHSKVLKLEVEILKKQQLKEQLQGRDDLIRNQQAQNDIMSLLNVGSTDDSCNKQALETELTQSKDTITSLKIHNDRYKKIGAQKAEIVTLNAKTVGNKTSGTTKPAYPKVIAPGMYAISHKYIVPQRRTNRETPIPFPKKKQVTFQETPKPSPRFTKKPLAPLLKKPNVNVPLSTGIKSATGASKPASKSNAWIYRKLPAKSAKGEKLEEHIRNLNKNNRVDSHVKCSVSVKKLNAVCGACHECLISSNHDNCLVYSMKSVNCKQPKAKNTMRTTKKVWRTKVVTSIKPMWKPIGWHFTLYDSYPLTRILEPTGWRAGSKGIPVVFE
nr:hypothetical protein [Tanacetum cinerariifolium]